MRRSPGHVPRLLRLRLQGVPYLVAKCDTPGMHDLLERHLRTGRYDVVYVGQLGMVAYLASAKRVAPPARFVLEEHNVEWEIFQRLAPPVHFSLQPAAHRESLAPRADVVWCTA